MAPKKLPDQEKRERREKRQFATRVQNVFKNAGFSYLATGGINHKFGSKEGELDAVFVYQNIILVVEDTTATTTLWNHLKNKAMLAREISGNKADFLTWLQERFHDRFNKDQYSETRWQVQFLYFPKTDCQLSEDDENLVSPVRVVQPSSLNYFVQLTQSIRKSARPEIFRFLGLRTDDIGSPTSTADAKAHPLTIIYPDEITGFKNGVKVVSFMMSAEVLLRNSYVLRKDNWEESIRLYQRLVDKNRIKKIREFLATNKSTFINNIIVSLPDDTKFFDDDDKSVEPAAVEGFKGHRMTIPDELNSICVIDGQHRIYAHYEGVDALEPQISQLRSKFHLLVTGLLFPPEMSQHERRRFESQIFLDINEQAKKVSPDVILFIETLRDPFSGYGIARQVLDRMNKKGPFQGQLQMSSMENARIKTASIIKFALRYLVQITDDGSSDTLFTHWGSEAQRLKLLEGKDEDLLAEYVNWCASAINTYFNALKATNRQAWNDPESKILSTTSINGFLIALRRSSSSVGVLDFDGYQEQMKKLTYDFSKSKFPYASSQYAMFSRKILEDLGISSDSTA